MRNHAQVATALLSAVVLMACTTRELLVEPREDDAGLRPDAGDGIEDDAGSPDAGPSLGGLNPDTAPKDQAPDLFGVAGHRFWFEAADAQVERLNLGSQHTGQDNIYVPGAGKTYADHMVFVDAADGSSADYGKTQLRLVGGETYRSWDASSIPNFRVDTDDFQPDQRLGGFEHFRLNNSLTGTIFREHMAHEIFRALGYPALRSTHAWVGNNVWGQDTWVPMTLIEVYKRRFCEDNQAALGGTCTNMWEFSAGLTSDPLPADRCQVSECDDSKLFELGDALRGLPKGPGFKKRLDKLISWPHFHQFQCMSWFLDMPDDPIHADGNHVIVERDSDHRLIWLPYSVDISQGHGWTWAHGQGLPGTSPIAQGCQSDPACWQDTVDTCGALLDKLTAAKPHEMLDTVVKRLEGLDMLRPGDLDRAMALREWYVERLPKLKNDLEYFRNVPGLGGVCPSGLTRCDDGGCATPDVCSARGCTPDEPWCPSRQTCISTQYDVCPDCPSATPFYCGATDQCLTDQFECTSVCIDRHGDGHSYCSFLGACATDGSCWRDGGGGGPIVD